MRDISKNISLAQSIDPQTISSNTTTNGTGVDVRDYDGVMVVFESNDAVADGAYVLGVEEADDDSTYTDVASADLIGTVANFSSSSEGIRAVGYIGIKRYVRATIVSTGTSSGGIMGGHVVRGLPHSAPTS